MKTTNFEISKKLKEAGFEAETDTLIHDPSNPITGERYASFCLETILEALPKQIEDIEKNYHFWVTYSGSSDCWIMGYVWGIERNSNFEKYNEGNESLADTAGRLWLLLKEKGLV